MDFRAVLTFLLLCAQAACGAVNNKESALNESTKQILNDLRTMLGALAAPELFPVIPCLPLNFTLLGEREQKLLTGHHLSSFRCYLTKLSGLTPGLLTLHSTTSLDTIGQNLKSMEEKLSGQTAEQDCSLPQFKQDLDLYVYVKCLLQHLDHRLSKASFDFTA